MALKYAYLEKPYELEECLAQAESLMQLYSDEHNRKRASFVTQDSAEGGC